LKYIDEHIEVELVEELKTIIGELDALIISLESKP
jgi:hypothetical protein